jgi:hypothetical protein
MAARQIAKQIAGAKDVPGFCRFSSFAVYPCPEFNGTWVGYSLRSRLVPVTLVAVP